MPHLLNSCIIVTLLVVVIGMGGESKEFAGELFDTLARRKSITTSNGISLEDLKMFWEDITNRDIDSRLQIFFDM